MSAYMQQAGARLFRQHLEHYAPPDPLYEYYTDTKGKQRRKKRDVPLGISSRDAKILKSVQRRARCLDKSFHFCGIRFGWTFVIGIVPGAGPVACAALGYVLVVRKARKADLPAWLIARMVANGTVAALVGCVPVLGDVVMAAYKANSRNALLLEEFLRVRGDAYLRLQAEKGEGGDTRGNVTGVSPRDAAQVRPGSGMEETGQDVTASPSPRAKEQTAVPARFSTDRGRFVENIE